MIVRDGDADAIVRQLIVRDEDAGAGAGAGAGAVIRGEEISREFDKAAIVRDFKAVVA